MTTGYGQNMDFNRFQNLSKIVYAKRVTDLTPDGDELAKECSFTLGERLGDEYHMPVTLTREGGVTFNNDGSVFNLNKPKARVTEKAKLRGNEMLLRSAMSYAVMNRAMTGTGSKEGDKKAFVNATKDTFVNLTKSASYFRELGILYGGGALQTANLGKVGTVVSAAGNNVTVALTLDSWSTGIWAGSEQIEYDFYDATATTKRNTAGTDTVGDTVFRLTGLAPKTRQLTFFSHATNVAAVAPGDIILFAGAYKKEQLGIEGACRSTGLLWGIDTAAYFLWQPQQFNVNGQLTFEKALGATAKSASVGFEGTLNLHVNPYTWQDLADDQAALVRHEKSGGKVTMGYNSIEYVGQTGTMRIKPNKYVKQGLAFALPDGNCMRVGSTDLTFEQPGFGRMLRELENAAGIEARIYMDNAFFCDLPGAMVLLTGIVNSSGSHT